MVYQEDLRTSAQGKNQLYPQLEAEQSDTEANVKVDILSYHANHVQFKKREKRHENLTSYADQPVEGFRAILKIEQYPMALSKLSEEDEAMFRSHSDAWSDIRQSMVWAFLGTEHFEPEE